MLATVLAIFGIASQISSDVPEFLQMIAIVKNAIVAFESGDQASMDAAHTAALALAESLKPAGV